jgi:benzoate membrane transport protein
MSPNADSNPNSRYRSAIALGLFYFIAGVLGTTIVSLFSSIPQTVILAIAGLALLPTLSNCITTSLKDEAYRESSLLTFVMTASSIELLGIGSAFWGLLLGLACYAIQFKQTQQ